jgi:hypothetical protein
MTPTTKFLAVGSLLISVPLWADDAPTEAPGRTASQKMHDCMERERAADPAKREHDMKRSCKAELNSQDNHPIVLPPALVPAHP